MGDFHRIYGNDKDFMEDFHGIINGRWPLLSMVSWRSRYQATNMVICLNGTGGPSWEMMSWWVAKNSSMMQHVFMLECIYTGLK